ncbi:MAG TPA: hypothetical protein VLD19_14370, partial [Chitinophagaceae bacterium]|nr:hypothetical protein [Chitinophagaceae bacterium]
MRYLLFILYILLFRPPAGRAQLPPVGQWREHLPYSQARRVVAAPGGVFCATPYALFSADPADNSIDRYSRMNGLSETGIQTIAWDAQFGKLVIAYTNSNIDVLEGNKITNINAILQKDVPGDKTVYNIFCNGGYAYLSDGLGIIVADESKYEIKDTWIIGDTGNTVRVNGFSTDGSFFYAATEEGLKKAPATGVNLSDYRNWQKLSGANGLSTGPCQDVLTLQNTVLVQKADS